MRARLQSAALVCWSVLASATPALARAQAQPTPVAATAPRITSSRDSTAPHDSWRVEQCMGGLTYGAPLKWALAYGMGFVRDDADSDWCVLATAKVGLGGAAMHIGVANAFAQFGSGTALTLGVIRTFDQPLNALARRTYVGASIHGWPILAIGGEIGWYTRVGKDPVGNAMSRSLLVWSTGFGF